MSKNIVAGLAMAASLIAVCTQTAYSQSAYFQAVTNLHPAAYWPLQETALPPAADVEPNLGSLGAVANAFYSSTNLIKGMTGIPSGDSDPAVGFISPTNGSFLAVPLTDSRVTLPAGHFTVEAWVFPTNAATASTIVAQTGPVGTGGLNGSSNLAGWSLNLGFIPSLGINQPNTVSFHVYNGVGAVGGAEAVFSTNSLSLSTWHHVVGVFDGVNAMLYVDTIPGIVMAPMTGTQALDTWDPLTIGCGRGLNNNRFAGSLDEIAIYTNALSLSRITAHFSTGTGGAGGYQAAVNADSPYMYWRMDAPGYSAPSLSAYPVAGNFGSINNASGLYLSGTIPGVAGPPLSGFGSPSYACAFNGIGTDGTNRIQLYTNGVAVGTTPSTSGVILTNMDPALNLVSNNVTFMCWFKANPADSGRGFQSIMCNGDRSWRMSLSQNAGQFGTVRCNPAENGEIFSATVVNDGNWHFAVDVYTNGGPASPSGWLGTNYLYVDGILQASAFTTNTAAIGLSSNVMIGCSSEFTVSGNGNVYQPQRHFPGSIAHAAYFTNSLSAAQVANLYVAAGGVPRPIITGQPVTGRINGAGGNNGSGPGSYIFFGVNALGATGYQWYFNSASNYSGATQLTEGTKYVGVGTFNTTVSNLVDSDSGYYYVVVTNSYASVTSILATLQVHTEPFITAQTPAGGPFQLYQGQNFNLSVSVVGQTNFSYQWYTNGVADTTGTGATYPLTGVLPALSGRTFQCIVTNTSGSATSILATLTVLPLPTNVTNSTYSSNLLALAPSGYWPMHEVAAPATGDVETNLGSLGNLANGYYADWTGRILGTGIVHQVTGALVADPDTATAFNNTPNAGAPTYPGFLVIPRAAAATTLTPPFTIEAWAKPFSSGFGDIVSENGSLGGTNQPNDGVRLSWGSGGGGAAIQGFSVFIGNGSGRNSLPGAPTSYAINQWYHVVCTFDGATWLLYVNGNVVINQPTNATFTLAVDTGSPIAIAQGLWGTGGPGRGFPGAIDEVAIYTNALDSAEIANHYNNGINPSPSISYKQMVLNTNPIIYLRMNGPNYNPPLARPTFANYGSVGGNGFYSPGTMPGAIPGPVAAGLPGSVAMLGSGMSSYGEVPFDPAFNPIGSTAFSYSAWFKGYPGDTRSFQAIVGHSDSSFRAAINSSGKLLGHAGSTDITTATTYNDGNWHQFLITYTGTNSGSANLGTNTLYVDGVQVGTSTGGPNAGSAQNIFFGNDPQYTNNPYGIGRAIAGSVCEVAYWSSVALSSNQATALWNAAGVPPSITSQPVSAAVNELSAFTNRVGVSGSSPLAYRWYYNGSSNYNGTAMTDSLDGRVTGTATSVLGLTNVHASDAGYYYVVATNNAGAITSAIVNLSVFTIPVISSYLPITYTNLYLLFAGASPTFKIGSASGAGPISYYWYTNGVKDTSVAVTTTSYQLHNLPVGSASAYCVLSNFVGMTTSFVWTASVGAAPTAPYPQSVLSLNPAAYLRLNEADDGLSDGNPGAIAHDYWNGNDGIYTNTALGQQGYSLGLANQYGNPSLATDPGTTSAQFGLIQPADSAVLNIAGVDFSSPTNTSRSFSIAAWAKATITAQPNGVGLVTKGYGNGGEQFDLDVFGSTYRFFVRDAGGAVHGPTSTVHLDGNWHQIVGVCDQNNGFVSLYVDGVSVASTSIPQGAGILASTNLVSIGARKSGINSSYDLQFQGYMNDVAIYNYALSASQVASNYITAGVVPEITQQPPANVSGPEGGTLTITAAALGTLPLSFDWFDASVLTDIPGGTNATLVISNLSTSLDGHTLHLIATNIYGQATSSDVQVSVVSGPPQIIVSNLPPQVLLPLGKSYTYSVQVTGTVPFYYQWYNNGSPLAGQTLSSFTITGNALGTSNISLVVSNIHSPPTATGSSVLTVIPLPTDVYATNILGLHPVGYWPLQETNPPGPVAMETNYGTLGHLGNAYYAMNVVASPRFSFNQGGALGSPSVGADNDPAVGFTGPSATNYAFVPQVTPALALHPPMSFETWVNSSSTAFGDLLSQGGAGLNVGAGNGLFAGLRVAYGGNNGGGPNLQVYSYNGVATGPNSYDSFGTPAGTLAFGVWHHCVMTFDGSTCILYIDGVAQASATIRFQTNSWTPFTIGDGRWLGDASTFGPTRSFNGTMDEVAVYTNVLTSLEVTNHFAAGMFTGSYMQTVLNDKPLLYYRMDSSGFVNPDPNEYPIAVNYGSAPVNAGYQGAVPPGAVPGPSILGLSKNVAAPINGVISCLDAGNDVTFGPTNRQPFSAMLWFRGYPGDGRVQTLISHGVTNWAMNLDGSTGRIVWNLFNGGNLTSTTVLNDGKWHMAVGVFDGTGSSLYVDGALNISTNSVLAGLAGEPGADLFVGGSPDFTRIGVDQRYWGGAVAQAAMFTNALTSAQIAHIYSVATVPTISIGYVGSSVVITYDGTLMSSSDVTQPLSTWAPVPGATPPTYVVPTGSAQKFYRARNP
jgi:hypothetical protein